MGKMDRDRAPERQQYGEELLCEPPHGPDDVLYSGSEDDYYETPRDRRILYERQARRFLDGYVPTLLSASLRGPFDTRSGWTNPWRSRRPLNPPGHAFAQEPDAGPALDATTRVAVESAGEETDEVEETPQLGVAVRYGKADVLARVHKPDPSLDVLPPSSFSRQSTVTSNPHMSDTDLVRVASWRDAVEANVAAREEFWLPDNRNNVAGGPKRSRQTEWLRRKALKRRKTGHAESFVYDSPIQAVMQNRPQHHLGPNSAPGSTTHEEDLAVEVSVLHRSFSQLPVETPLSGSTGRYGRSCRGTDGSAVEPAVTSALPRSKQTTGDASSRNSSFRAAFKSSASTVSSHAAPHESLSSASPDSDLTIPQVSDTTGRASRAAQGSSEAAPEVLVKREERQEGKKLKFESQEDESFYYRARPRTRTGLRSQASHSSSDAAVHEADTPQMGTAKETPCAVGGQGTTAGISMVQGCGVGTGEALAAAGHNNSLLQPSRDEASVPMGGSKMAAEEAPHSEIRPRHVLPRAPDAQSLSEETTPSVSARGSPANTAHIADNPHEANEEDDADKDESSDAGVLPIQIPMSQEEWGLGLYRVIAEHFDLSRPTEGHQVGEAVQELPERSLQISHMDGMHEALPVSPGEDEEPCQEMVEVPADDEAGHTPAPTVEDGTVDGLASSPRDEPQCSANGKGHTTAPETEPIRGTVGTIVGSVQDEETTIHVKEDPEEESRPPLPEEKLAHQKEVVEAHGVATLGDDDTTLSVAPAPSQSPWAGKEMVHGLAIDTRNDMDRNATDSMTTNLRDGDTTLDISKSRCQSPWTRSTEPPLAMVIKKEPSLLPAPRLHGLGGIASQSFNVAASQQSPWNGREAEPCLLDQQGLTPRSADEDFAPELTGLSMPLPQKSALNDGSEEQATHAVSSQAPPSTPETKHSGLPTPDFSLSIKSFAKFRTPSPPKRQSLRASLGNGRLPSTQGLVDAALSNPWAKSSVKKPERRVSFAPLPGETPSRGGTGIDKENEDVGLDDADVLPRNPGAEGKAVRSGGGRAASPPIATPASDLPDYDRRFTSHFEAMAKASRMRLAARRRRPRLARRLLPSASQQVASSPSVGAMAEAFIAAEELAKQPPPARARTDEDTPSSWQEDEDDDDVELPSFGAAEEPVDDVSAVMHNLGDFLDSWDVDDELAKARPGGAVAASSGLS